MAVRERVALPPASPRLGGLLASARPLEELTRRWQTGVTFASTGCVGPHFEGPCERELTTVAPMEPDAVGDVVTFVPTDVFQVVNCSALYLANLEALTDDRLDVTREWAAGHVLQTGEHTAHEADGMEVDNPALVDAVDLNPGAPLPVLDALACLEQTAAQEFYGGPVFIHASPLMATHLLGVPGIHRDGRRWITASGSVLVISPGYTGNELYATSEVFSVSGGRATRADVDRETNTAGGWSDELVLSIFDPCWFGRVNVDVTLCGTT